jgi:formylglycine-generating enzyme required for sulfatase activity
MGETEVTQELFAAVYGRNPSDFDGSSGKEAAPGETQNRRPVEHIKWYQAIVFCNRLSVLDNKQPVYSVRVSGTEVDWATVDSSAGISLPSYFDADWDAVVMDVSANGYRLPTEMEWMWAAMGADTSVQPNTTGYDKGYAGSTEGVGQTNIDNYAWNINNSGGMTHEVGKKTANELGLYDMSGNVSEMCWDLLDTYPSGNRLDYRGPSSASPMNRVSRGGNWGQASPITNCTVSHRTLCQPYPVGNGVGLRIVCNE